MEKERKSEEKTAIEEASKSPKSMPFILCNIFIERFCSAGVAGKLRRVKNEM